MYFLATLIIDFLAALLLIAAIFAGVAAYQEYANRPSELQDKKPAQAILAMPELQGYAAVCGTTTLLFVVCMVGHAVIDTARTSRKILRHLEETQKP